MVSWIKFGVILLSSVSLMIAAITIPQSQAGIEQLAVWGAPPTVRICSNTPISKYRVEEALNFWRNLGYEFGTILYNDSTNWCSGSVYFGSITIMPSQSLFNSQALAQTNRMSYNKLVVGARIEIRPDSYDRPLLLEHELGHALGWPHYNIEGHVMHRALSKAGKGVLGVERP